MGVILSVSPTRELPDATEHVGRGRALVDDRGSVTEVDALHLNTVTLSSVCPLSHTYVTKSSAVWRLR